MPKVNTIARTPAAAAAPVAMPAGAANLWAQMMAEGTSSAPVESPWEGLSRVAKGALGAYQTSLDHKRKLALQKQSAEDMARLAQAVQPGQWTNPDDGKTVTYGGGMAGLAEMLESGQIKSPDVLSAVSNAMMSKALNPPKPTVLSPGQVAFGADGQRIAGNEAEAEVIFDDKGNPALIKKPNGEIVKHPQATLTPAQFQQQLALAKGKASVNKIIMPPREREGEKVFGRHYAESYIDLQKAGRTAGEQSAKLARLEGLLDKVRTTGLVGSAKRELAKLLNSLGANISPDEIANAEAAQGQINDLLVAQIGRLRGTGAITDTEGDRMLKVLPTLANTKGGNKLIIETLRQGISMQRDVAKLARDYKKQHGSLDEGWDQHLSQWQEKQGLLGADFEERAAAAAGDEPLLPHEISIGTDAAAAVRDDGLVEWTDPETGKTWLINPDNGTGRLR